EPVERGVVGRRVTRHVIAADQPEVLIGAYQKRSGAAYPAGHAAIHVQAEDPDTVPCAAVNGDGIVPAAVAAAAGKEDDGFRLVAGLHVNRSHRSGTGGAAVVRIVLVERVAHEIISRRRRRSGERGTGGCLVRADISRAAGAVLLIVIAQPWRTQTREDS